MGNHFRTPAKPGAAQDRLTGCAGMGNIRRGLLRFRANTGPERRILRYVVDVCYLRQEIASLEERAAYIFDLSTCLHDHQEMLWRIEDKLRTEATRLKQELAREQGPWSHPNSEPAA